MEKTPKPMLMDELNTADKVKLAQTMFTPGWQVVTRMIESACHESRIDINDANPEEPNYEHILKARQQYSRAINKFSALLLRSIEYHVEHGASEEAQQKEAILKASLDS